MGGGRKIHQPAQGAGLPTIHVLMRDEKEERSKPGQANNKARQHSTPKAVTFPNIYSIYCRLCCSVGRALAWKPGGCEFDSRPRQLQCFSFRHCLLWMYCLALLSTFMWELSSYINTMYVCIGYMERGYIYIQMYTDVCDRKCVARLWFV